MRPLQALLPLLLTINICVFAQTAESLYDEGVKLKNDNQSGQALLKFKRAIELKPGYTEAQYEMGWCQNDTKDYSGAITNLQNVRQAWSTVPKVFFELAYAYEKLQNYDSATANYYKCLSYKSDYANVYKQLGYIEYQKNNYSTAISHYKTFIEMKNGVVDDYLVWYRKGFCENVQKDYNSAMQSLLQAEKLKKDYINIYLELGFASKNLKKNEDAISYYNQAIAVDPKSHIPYNGIGEVYRDNLKDMDNAMEWYKKTLAINANERKGNFGMGYCLNSLKRYNEAIPYLKTAIANEKDYTAAYTELGYSYYKTGNDADALFNLGKSLSINPNGINPLYYSTLVYLKQKNKSKAQEMVNTLKKLGSKYGDELQKNVDAL